MGVQEYVASGTEAEDWARELLLQAKRLIASERLKAQARLDTCQTEQLVEERRGCRQAMSRSAQALGIMVREGERADRSITLFLQAIRQLDEADAGLVKNLAARDTASESNPAEIERAATDPGDVEAVGEVESRA